MRVWYVSPQRLGLTRERCRRQRCPQAFKCRLGKPFDLTTDIGQHLCIDVASCSHFSRSGISLCLCHIASHVLMGIVFVQIISRCHLQFEGEAMRGLRMECLSEEGEEAIGMFPHFPHFLEAEG